MPKAFAVRIDSLFIDVRGTKQIMALAGIGVDMLEIARMEKVLAAAGGEGRCYRFSVDLGYAQVASCEISILR